MIAELGHLLLWLAFALSIVLSVAPLLGIQRQVPWLVSLAWPLAWGTFLLLTLAILALGYAFYDHDFTLTYVANHSNSQLPLAYRLSAVWGGHEGSLLLWAWMLGFWLFLVSVFGASVPRDMVARVMAVMGMVAVGFLAFMLLTSNPFDRTLPWFPMDGADLNPLLQDPGLVVHPPMLYMGYVGFSVAFAFAIAGLLSGKLDPAWARWARPWTTLAWCFLTVGIALGSWWAYYELGWGGWWFWDPVENASFMPWLCGTALIHSLAVTEKRGMFRAWTVMLAILAFSLSLLGTFLVRSGVLTSVHAFANDPSRGAFILGFLVVVVGGSLLLFALRAPVLRQKSGFQPLSRETFLLINNLLLLVATVVVLVGTLAPLFGQALDVQISISSPYFNLFFVPLTLILMAFLAPGMLTNWKRHDGQRLKRDLLVVAPLSVLAGLALAGMAGELPWVAVVALVMVAFVWITHLYELVRQVRAFRSGLMGLRRVSRAWFGMALAHCGLALVVAGVTLVSFQDIERDLRMAPGDRAEVGGYQFTFDSLDNVAGPNYDAIRGVFVVSRGEQLVHPGLHAEKRTYRVSRQVMTEAGIDGGLMRDLYVALGEPLEGDAWAVRIYYKPGVRWLWLGALIMGAGGLLALSDRRYRRRQTETAHG